MSANSRGCRKCLWFGSVCCESLPRGWNNGIGAMMGAPVGRQDRLFHEFDLEEVVPGDHLRRRIDTALDPSRLRGEMKPHYSHLGCIAPPQPLTA